MARLLALVPDPAALHGEMSKKEHGYVRDRAELLDPGHRAWINVVHADTLLIVLMITIDLVPMFSVECRIQPWFR